MKEREREKKEILALRAFRTFVSLRARRSFRAKSRRRFRLRVCLDRILHLITRKSRRLLAMSRKGGERERHDASPRSGSRLNVVSHVYILGITFDHDVSSPFFIKDLYVVRDAALKRDQTPWLCSENGRDILMDDEDQRSLRKKRACSSRRRSGRRA